MFLAIANSVSSLIKPYISKITSALAARSDYYENIKGTNNILFNFGAKLLDKASIVLTPTAYSDGSLNTVIPPYQVLPQELVTNGTFDTDSDWSLTSNVAISGGKLNFTNATTNTHFANQFISAPVGRIYKITLEVSNLGSGEFIKIRFPFQDTSINANGTYTIFGEGSTANGFRITPASATATFSIDNVSVKEVQEADFDFSRGSSATRVNEKGLIEDVQILSSNLVQNGDFEQVGSELVTNGNFATDSDWTKGTGVTISDGKANWNNTSNNIGISQNGALTIGKTYKIKFTISNYVSGSARIRFPFVEQRIQANGTYIFYGVATTDGLYIQGLAEGGNPQFSIDNVSVKEVGQNWTLGSGWSIGDSKAIFDGTQSYIQQNNLGASGVNAIYKVKWTQNITAGTRLRFFARNYNDSGNETILSGSTTGEGSFGLNGNCVGSGTFTAFVSSTNGYSFKMLGETGVNADITNISVVEITDDTDIPRIDYTSGQGALLLEPQSTNLITYSEDFSGWSKDDITVESDSDTSPDGNNKATLLKGNTNSSRHHIRKTLTGTVDGSYSIYAKAEELRYLQIASINTTNQYVNFDLQDGLVGTVGSDFSNAKIEQIGNGWYRLSVTSDDRYNSFYISLVSGTNATWLESWAMSNNTDGLYIWGAQLEQKSFATSYIPTEASTVTRSADVANNSGNADLINSTEGVLYAEISALANDLTNRFISLTDGTQNNSVCLFYGGGSSNFIRSEIKSNNVTQAELTTTSYPITNFNKIAVKYKGNDFALWVDGVEVATDTSGSTPIGLNDLSFNRANILDFYGNVKCVAVFKEALTDAELESLTSWVSFTEMATDLEYTLE